MTAILPTELWIRIALCASYSEPYNEHDEYVFNALARAIGRLGRWTIGASDGMHGTYNNSLIINRRLDLMLAFGYSVYFRTNHISGQRYITWEKNNEIHHNDVPARVWCGGDVSWWKHGKQHRVDGPAVVCYDGDFRWKQHGRSHRDDGPAESLSSDGVLVWNRHGIIDRECGPAFINSYGQMTWYRNGIAHRDHGPTFIQTDGTCEFYIHGNEA